MLLEYSGVICSGAGKSTKWMKIYLNSFYPGTMNIKLDRPKHQIIYDESINTKYGRCYLGRCWLNELEVSIVLPPRATLDDNYIELGYHQNLKELLNLQTGNTVNIKFYK